MNHQSAWTPARRRAIAVAAGVILSGATQLPGFAREAAAQTVPTIVACPTPKSLKVDGKLIEPEWLLAVTGADLHKLGSPQAAASPLQFRWLYSPEALFLGIDVAHPAGSRQAPPRAVVKEHDGPVFTDDSVELYLRPTTPGPYYHFVVNTAGIRYDAKEKDVAWNADWTAVVTIGADGWQAEMRIPYASLGLAKPPEPGQNWHFNLVRNDRLNQEFQSWANLTRGFHEPANFGQLRFAGAALGVTPLKLHRRGTDLAVELELRPGTLPEAKAVTLELDVRTAGGEFTFRPETVLEPGRGFLFSTVFRNGWQPTGEVRTEYRLRAGTELLYQSPAAVRPAVAILPATAAAPDPVTIGNATVSLRFDRDSGWLLGAENRAAGIRLELGGQGRPMLEMDTVRFIKNPRFFREEDVQVLVPDAATLESCTPRDDAAGQSVEFRWRLAGSLAVRATVTVPPAGVETEWRLELENPRSLQPSQSLVVHRVRYPWWTGVPETACGENPYVVTTQRTGQKIPDPVTNLSGHNRAAYPGNAAMGWFDFFGARGGLYFKVGDLAPLPQTELVTEGDVKTRTLRLGIQRWALCWPGETWAPGAGGVALHGGDWHAAADLYRTWYRTHFTRWPAPEWLQEADGYVMTGTPDYEFADFPRILENAKAIGLSYLQVWSQMTGGETTFHAFGFPNPYMGTPEELKSAIAEVHRRGGHIGFYLNFNTGDPLLGTYLRQPALAQKIPSDIPRPALDYLHDNWLAQSLMNYSGSYSKWNVPVPGFLDGYWNACPAADKWTAFYAYWAIDKWAREYGADVWYLDSCPVSRGSPCFAFDHGHSRPVAEGQSILDFYQRLRSAAPAGFTLMQEYASDRLLPYSTHALGLMWHTAHAWPEVLRYTLPEYPLFSGMCNGTEGLANVYPGEKPTWQDALERVFLLGNRYEMGMSRRPPDLADEWSTKMVRLRRACRAEMNAGDFLDGLGLGPLPERVYARLFRRADRNRLVVTLLDRRTERREPFELTVDGQAAGVAAALGQAELVTLDGTRKLPVPPATGGSVKVQIPVYAGRPAALLLTP